MATVDELLSKQKGRLQKMSVSDSTALPQEPRKKIQRTGPTRPWQENLPKYQNPVDKSEGSPITGTVQNVARSENKVEPKLSQSEAKPRPQPEPKLSQSEAKVEPPVTNRSESWAKVGPQPRPQPESKLSQSEAKVEPNDAFSSLVGLQKDTLLYIFDSCRFRGSKVSGPIAIQNLAVPLNSTSAAVRKAIQRLEQKGCLRRASYKDGRGGWTEYQVADDIYSALLLDKSRAKVEPNIGQSKAKVGPQPEPQPRPSPLSSSSYLNNTTTNYQAGASETITIKIPDELKKLGFSENHLMQLKRDSKLPLESISASIEALAYDLTFDDVKKKIRSPIGLIMKLLKAGEMYLSEKGFESEEDRLFRECVQRAEKQSEEKKKLMEKFIDLKFEEWIESKSDDDLLKIASPVGEFKGTFHIQQLRDYFIENEFKQIERELQ